MAESVTRKGPRIDAPEIVPCSLAAARAFVAEHHRHSPPDRGWLFGCALEVAGERVGVVTAGRPKARALQDGRTVEVTRVCVDPAIVPRNACSTLYARACRAASALGYTRAVTYTINGEDAASVRAAGFRLDAEIDARADWPARTRAQAQLALDGERAYLSTARRRWVRDL